MENTDPLKNLIIDTKSLDRKKLSDLLTGYCAISTDGQVRLLTEFSSLDLVSKILVILLAKKASHALKLTSTEKITSKEIRAVTGIPGSTIRGKLMQLRHNRLVESDKGNHFIPNYSLNDIALNTNSQEITVVNKNRSKKNTRYKSKKKSDNLLKLLNMDHSQVGESRLELLLSKGKYIEKALTVLSIAREQEINALTPMEITSFLKEKIRVASVSRSNISLALGRGTRYVDRKPYQGGYIYEIMIQGENFIHNIIDKQSTSKKGLNVKSKN